MKKFISYEKLSKKEKRKVDSQKRKSWGALNPTTRKPPNPKAYNRKKNQCRKKDLFDTDFFIFFRRLIFKKQHRQTNSRHRRLRKSCHSNLLQKIMTASTELKALSGLLYFTYIKMGLQRMTARYFDDLSRQHFGLLTCKEQNGFGNVFGLNEFAHRDERENCLF